MNPLVIQILDAARHLGLSQKDLAQRVGLPEETISRLKRKASVRTDVLERLAHAVGLSIALTPQNKTFQEKHKTLVWSNPKAPPEVFVRKALLRPHFSILLDAAVEFGLPFVQEQWRALEAEQSKEAARASPTTTRMLRNLTDGYQQARA